MSQGSLLVLLDPSKESAQRVQAAVRLAAVLDWHLLGVASTDLRDLRRVPAGADSLSASAARVWDRLRDQAERAVDQFRVACHAAGVASFEARIDETDTFTSMLAHARCSDLVVLTQADAVSGDTLVEDIVLHSPRPTLVLPRVGHHGTLGERVLVAWNDTREAARAASDALPLLRRAQRVELVRWTDDDGPYEPEGTSALAAPRAWLARHDVLAHAEVVPARGPLAHAMRERTATSRADLLVMGAYGHARWAEAVLGGATRDLLASTTVPLLMSH
jgi:nucleotide-binding universal stress UspA family protein